MTRIGNTDPAWVLGAGLLAALILSIDLLLPLGVAGGVPYVALVGFGWYGRGTRQIVALGVVSTLLTAVGYFYSPDGGVAWVVLANRFLAIFAVWVTVVLLIVAKRAREKVGASQRRLSGLLVLAPQAVISVDESQCIQLFNKGAEAIFGYSAEEVLGRPLHILLPARYRDEHPKHLTRFSLASAAPRAMGKHRKIIGLRKDGSEFPAKGAISKLDLAGETAFTVMLYDCTEEEEAEQRIVELARFADEDPSPVLRVDPDGTVRYANRAAREAAELFAGDDQKALTGDLAEDVARALAAGSPHEIDFTAGDRTLALALTPVAGEPYLNLYGRDVTPRKMAEAALREANETLEQRVEERTTEYEAANLALQAEVAEHRRTEKKLRNSRTRLNDAIESISEGFILFDANERLVLCNDTYRDLYPMIADLLTPGARLEDLIRGGAERGQVAEAAGDVEEWVQRRLADYRRADGTIEQQTGDGRWVLASERRTQEGGVVGVRTDITDRRRAGEELARNEERLRQATQLAGLGYSIWDAVEGRCLHCSEEYARFHGMTVGGYLAQASSPEGDLTLKHPEDRERYSDAIAKVRAGESFEVECRVITPEGETRHLREMIEPVFDENGSVVREHSVILDVTKTKRAELALRESRALLQAVIDVMPAIVNVKDRDGRFVIANPAQTAFYGLTPDQVVGKTVEDLVDSDYADLTQKADRGVLEGGPPLLNFVDRGVDAEGRETVWLTTKLPLKAADASITGVLTVSIDITELKRAEAALRASEAQFRDLIAGSIQGVLIHRDGELLFANQAVADIFGYDDAEEVIALPSIRALEAGHEHERLEAFGRARLSSGDAPEHYEFEGVRKDGSPIWLENFVTLVEWNGKPAIQTTTINITDRKRAEVALKENEARLRQAARTAHLGHWVWDDAAETYTYCSEELASLYGYTAEEYLAKFATYDAYLDAIHPDDRASLRREIAKSVKEQRPYDTEYRARTTGKEYRWFREIGEPVRDEHGRRTHTMGIVQDVTDFRKAERALRESEAQFHDLIAGSIQGVLIHRDGEALFANQALADIFGYEDPGELLALPTVDVLKADRERERLKAYSTARLRYGSAPERYEYEGVRKDGSPIWLENFVTVVEWNGEPAVQTTTVDITERKRVEEALARSSEDLKVARDQADAANRAKSEFLATMSHELRTPLNAIIGFSEIIKSETFGPVGSAQYRGYAADIHGSGQHLLSLINDILDLSKVESGTEELHEEDVCVPDIADTALRLVRQRAERAGVELELDLAEDLPLLHADERKVKQILVNLLTNAVKFTDADGTVTLKAWCRHDSGFVFQVIDTGVGIAPEDIPKALSQFGQVDSKRNRTQEGTGLGLPLSKSLAELHGGSLDLQSRVGAGTTATVRFPAARIVPAAGNVSAERSKAAV